MVKRLRYIGLKLTQDEYEYLIKKAHEDSSTCWKNGSKNISAYIRKCVLQATGFKKELWIRKELSDLTYQIRKIGVNINQATKKINTNVYDTEVTERLHNGMEQINENVQKLIEKLEKIDGYGSNETDEH